MEAMFIVSAVLAVVLAFPGRLLHQEVLNGSKPIAGFPRSCSRNGVAVIYLLLFTYLGYPDHLSSGHPIFLHGPFPEASQHHGLVSVLVFSQASPNPQR